MQTRLLRQQHSEIARLLDSIDRVRAIGSEQELCVQLVRLAGIVKLHLTLEDKNLYPTMLRHADPEVRATAQLYKLTMAELAPAYTAFHETWTRPQAISTDRLRFAREFESICEKLRKRIDLENHDLYDVADANVELLPEIAS
ncbi:MAG: hypothetical protein JO322_08460 [Candidatus Eremiobacteraeota bacterium]|nr:hypothetical protein [Candidatus Eremiobacteraeota bacterium]